MILRTIGLAAVGLALAADAIMIPSTVTLPGLTAEAIDRQGDVVYSDDDSDLSQPLIPIPDDVMEKMKDLHLGVSKPFPFFGQDDDDDEGFYFDDDYDYDYGFADDEPVPVQKAAYDDDEDVVTIFLDDPFYSDSDGDMLEETIADPHNLYDDDFDRSECPTGSSPEAIFCRIRAALSSKFAQVKPYFTEHRHPCPKKLAAMQGATSIPGKPPVSGGPNKFWQYFKDKGIIFYEDNADGNVGKWVGDDGKHRHSSHRHHHHHADGNKFMRILHSICAGVRTFVTSFLVPILIGVAAGMTASLVGMCVGTILAWLWIKFVRGGKRGNARAVVIEEVEIENGEKDGLLAVDVEEVDAPPVYEEKVQL